MRARNFEDARASFDAKAHMLQNIFDQGGGTAIQRSALNGAQSLAGYGQKAFYGGNVLEGSRLMTMALVVLDVATSITPGISWGRDIYEATTGRNLITGDELTTAERTVAVLGAISGGIAGEGPKLLRALEHAVALGESAEKAEHILQAA